MKKLKYISIILIVVLSLVSCTNSSKSLSSDEVSDNVSKSFDKLDSVSQTINLDIENNMNDIVEISSQSIEIIMAYNNDNISHIHSITESIQNNNKSKVEFYKVPEGTYINQNEIWQEYSGPEKYTSTYKPILDTFLSISSKLEMIENSDNYTFKFEGKDGNVFRTIAEPFSITFGQLSDDDIELDIEFIVEKEDFFIKDFSIDSFANYDNNKEASIKTQVSFDDFNEIDSDDFPIPEGLDEVSNII